MTNGVVIGLSALAGVWIGWYAIPICLAIVGILLLIEHELRWSLLLAALVFSSIGAWRSDDPAPMATNVLLTSSSGAVGRIDSFPRPSGDGHRVNFSVSEICAGDQCIPAEETVVLYVADQNPPISRGQVIRVDWNLQALAELPPGYRGFVQAQNATASARTNAVQIVENGPRPFRWLASANESIATSLTRLIPGDSGALATGIVTGDDSELSATTRENFKATGTTHITAVSGQNVTIILGFLTMWWHPKSARMRLLFHLGLLVVIWSYALLVGLEAPAFRAAVVASMTIVSGHVGRRPDPVTSLVLTLGGMALWQPLLVLGVGFWLSASASLALCLALPKHFKTERPAKAIFEISLGPVVASLATMPIVLMTFGTWSPITILANILISPVITLAFWATYPFALIALFVPWLADILYWIPGMLLNISLIIVEWLAPLAASLRVDSLSPYAMLALFLPIGLAIWLYSKESDRWIRLSTKPLVQRQS